MGGEGPQTVCNGSGYKKVLFVELHNSTKKFVETLKHLTHTLLPKLTLELDPPNFTSPNI